MNESVLSFKNKYFGEQNDPYNCHPHYYPESSY